MDGWMMMFYLLIRGEEELLVAALDTLLIGGLFPFFQCPLSTQPTPRHILSLFLLHIRAYLICHCLLQWYLYFLLIFESCSTNHFTTGRLVFFTRRTNPFQQC